MSVVILTGAELDALYARLDEQRACIAALREQAACELPIYPLGLTRQEFWVLLMFAQGYSDKQIGARLQLSWKTVRFHGGSILRKLGVENRTQAALCAWRAGIITVEEAWETVKTLQWRSI